MASANGHLDIVEKLVDAGAVILLRHHDAWVGGTYAIAFLVQASAWPSAWSHACTNDISATEWLLWTSLADGHHLSRAVTSWPYASLQKHCSSWASGRAVELLSGQVLIASRKDVYQTWLALWLLQDVNSRNESGNTPLHWACLNGQAQVSSLLHIGCNFYLCHDHVCSTFHLRILIIN